MRLETTKILCVLLTLLLVSCSFTSVFAAPPPIIDMSPHIQIYGDDNGNMEMTGQKTGIFHYKILEKNAVDITSKVPASRISVDAFIKSDNQWGSNGKRAEVSLDPMTGTATVTGDFSDSDKSIFITVSYNSNISMQNFDIYDLITGSKMLNLNNSYDFNKDVDIQIVSDYLTDIGNNTATFKYKALYAGRDITNKFPASLIEASTNIGSSIDFDPSTGTGIIKFDSPVKNEIIRTTLRNKLNGVTSILNSSGLSKTPVKRQKPTEVSKINFVTGSIVKIDNETATFKYKVLDYDNSNITKMVSTDDIKAFVLIDSGRAQVSLDPKTGTGTIKCTFTDNDKKAMVTLNHKSGVEIASVLNIVESESINYTADDNDLQVARIAFLPTGIKDFDRRVGLTYRIYNQYGKDITNETPATKLAFSSSVNSMIYKFSFGYGELVVEYNTLDSDRSIIVSVMDKATGVRSAMNLGKPPVQGTDYDDDSDTVNDSSINEKVIKFNDAALEQAIRKLIFKPEADITVDDVKNITHLSVDLGCTDLSGIENLKNLVGINFGGSNINSLALLKQLPNLRSLQFTKGSINDIKTLTELTDLATLDIRYTKISDADLTLLKKALTKCYILQ